MPIRLAELTDAPAIQAIYAPYVTDTTISFEVEVPSVATMRERIAKTLDFHPWLVYVQDDAVIGYAYAGKHRDRAAYQWSTDVSVYVSPAHQRKGIGRTLYTELFALLLGSRASATPSPGSRCPTRRASASTVRWASP